MPEQRIQVIFHVPNEASETGLRQLFRATCLCKAEQRETNRHGHFELVKCIDFTGGLV